MNNQAKKYRKYYEALDLIGCKHVSTPRQIKNGTRVFRLPFKDAWNQDIEFATYKSGYVRKQNGADRAYQLNPVYEQNNRWVWQRNNGELYISKGMTKARALIYSPITRLNFMLNYYLKNYAK